MKRTIGLLSLGRTDWNHWQNVAQKIKEHPDLELKIYATSMHLSPEFGLTYKELETSGFTIDEKVEILLSSDSPQGVAKAIGLGCLSFAQIFEKSKPDILLVLGDRFETLSVVTAALPFNIPVAHAFGGETTEGAIDDCIRHAISKLSHLHFVSTNFYAYFLEQNLGEEAWRINVVGAPSTDSFLQVEYQSKEKFLKQWELDLKKDFLLVTFHPVTTELENTERDLTALLWALEKSQYSLLITYPNADTHGRLILKQLEEFRTRNPSTILVPSLGLQGYANAMKHTVAMVGNSSSGIFESASFKCPVVNIGNRQKGRPQPRNIIQVDPKKEDIWYAIEKATSLEFKKQLENLKNPYGDGHCAEKMIEVLAQIPLDKKLTIKRATLSWSKNWSSDLSKESFPDTDLLDNN